jgi:hypothetical protein
MSDEVLRDFMVSLGFKVDEASMKKFTLAVEGITKGVMSAGLAVTAATTAIVAGVGVISSQMERLYYASQRSGESVGNIMALRHAAGQIGLTADQAQSSLEGFARTLRLNPGTDSLLSSLGVKGDGPEQKFESFIGKMKELQPYVAAQYAALFGIDPDTLLMLENGLPKLEEEKKKYIERLAAWNINPEQAAASGKDFNNAIRSVKADFELLWVVIESKLVPVMIPLIERFERWARSHAADTAEAIAKAVEKLGNWIASIDWDKTADRIDKVVDALGGAKGVLAGIALISFSGVIGSILGLVGAIAKIGIATAGLGGGAAVAGAGALALGAAGVGAATWGVTKFLQWLMPNHKRGDIDPKTGMVWVPGTNGRGGSWQIPEGGLYRHYVHGSRAGGGRWEGRDFPASGVDISANANSLADSPLGALISRGEGGYNSVNRGKAGGNKAGTEDLEKMTVLEVMAAQKAKKFNAAGRYQVIPSTLADAVKSLGMSGNEKFDKATQDKIFEQYLVGKKQKAIGDYITGKSNDLQAAIKAASKEWASVADPETGMSHYAGIANNKASISAAQMAQALEGTRLGAQQQAANNITLTQKTDIHVAAAGDSQSTARAIASEQDRVNSDMMRNFAGGVS